MVRAAVPSINVSLAPNVYPRSDLRTVLLQGIPNVNAQELVGPTQCDVVTAPPLADMIRLNTKIAATARDQQSAPVLCICAVRPNIVGRFSRHNRRR